MNTYIPACIENLIYEYIGNDKTKLCSRCRKISKLAEWVWNNHNGDDDFE